MSVLTTDRATVGAADWTITAQTMDGFGAGHVVVEAVPGQRAWLTPAGVAAVLSQISTYLSSGKCTSIAAAGSSPSGSGGEWLEAHVTGRQVRFSTLLADYASQVSSLKTLLGTPANVAVGK